MLLYSRLNQGSFTIGSLHPPPFFFLLLHPHNRWFYVKLEWLITQVGSGISLPRAELRQWGVALRGWHLSNAPVIRRTSFIRLTSVDSKKLNLFFLFLTSELQDCWNFGCIFLLLFFPGWPFVVRVVSQATCRLTKLWSFSYRCHYLLLPLSFSFPWICLLRLVRRSSSGIVCQGEQQQWHCCLLSVHVPQPGWSFRAGGAESSWSCDMIWNSQCLMQK